MNAFDLLNENDKIILLLLLKRTPMSQVADLFRCTVDDVCNVRLQMIAKFEQASPFKSPKTRRF
jgi:hypothetical protein